jgi:hypothetical protein
MKIQKAVFISELLLPGQKEEMIKANLDNGWKVKFAIKNEGATKWRSKCINGVMYIFEANSSLW